MSADEVFALGVSGVVTFVAAVRWYGGLIAVTRLAGGGAAGRVVLAVTPAVCVVLVIPVLRWWAAREVREDARYVVLFVLGAVVWLCLAVGGAATLGINARGDAVERRNRGAAIALVGAMVGMTLCYAGANIGEGATVWMTYGPAALGALVLVVLWWVVAAVGGINDAVAIDRDAASGWRLAGFLVACGLILGRALAGDYVSAAGTVADLIKLGWPILLWGIGAVVLQFMLGPRPSRPRASVATAGVVPCVIGVGLAVAYVLWLGPWNVTGRGVE